MPERTGYPDGEPCWTDVTTPGRQFYSAVFGWTLHHSGPGDYAMFLKDGRPVAGLTPPHPGGPEDQAPPMWSVYLATSDVDDTMRRIERAGGKIVIAPMDFPGSGRMVYAVDPAGAPFGAWQPVGHLGSRLTNEPGTPCWAELRGARNGDAADAFYRSVFEYDQEPSRDDDTIWRLAGREVCGRLAVGEEFPPAVPAHWMIYFAVSDADATASRITDGGGVVRRGPFDSPRGRVVVATDPYGAVFSVVAR